MSFFNSTPPTSYKPQVRVEGFHLPSPGTPPGSSGTNNSGGSNPAANNNNGGHLNDLFPHSFLPDAFRKFPAPAGSGEGSHDFNDDLVSLIGDRAAGSAQSGGNGGGNGTGPGAGGGGGGGGAYDEGYHRTHNIFDVSSPIPVNSNPNGGPNGPNGPGSQPSSLHSPSTSLHDYQHHPPPHFNSTLPALNSSMRYEPPPENNPLTPSSPQPLSNAPPSSYHAPHNGFPRHTPSPIHSQTGSVPINGRSRSRSRPPSSAATGPANALNTGGVGPARTTRTRRGNSISGTSPPPLHGRPHAILIPGSSQRNSHGGIVGGPMSAGANPGSNPWFMSQGPNPNSTDYLPTPESLGSHSIHSSISSHHHSHSQSQSGYGPFSLSPPPLSSGTTGSDLSHHLPPLHHMAHSLPKSPMEQHIPPHHHHQQHHLGGSGLPKSPLDHGYPTSYAFGNGTTDGNSPPGASPGSLPNGMNGGMGSAVALAAAAAGPVGGVTPTGSGYGMGGMSMSMNMGGMPGSAPNPGIQGPAGLMSGSGSGSAPVVTSDKQVLLANEKRRRRRESHNAVERRRRDNINEKISELATLIPECMLDGSAPPNAKDPGTSVTPPITEDALIPKAIQDGALKQEKDDDGTIPVTEGGTVVKANKGMILRKSVEYIRYLQQLVTAQGARNRELEQELRKYRGSSVSSDSPSSPTGGDGSGNIGTDYGSMFNIHSALTLDDEDDVDDSMSLGIGGGVDGDGSMVLHDEFVSSPTLASASVNSTSNGAAGVMKPSGVRKTHHKHSSSSSRPKPSRLPSMPEEDMEVDKGEDDGNGNGDGGSLSPDSSSHGHDGHGPGDEQSQNQLERGRTRGVRAGLQGMKEEGGVNGGDEANGGGVDHAMGGMDSMFGMLNGHQMHGHQQQVMGW